MTKRKSRTRMPVNDLSLAEIAWLTGDTSQIQPDSWEEFFFDGLNDGFNSMHHGRAISPSELLAQYGHLCSPSRRKELQAKITERETKGRPVIKAGKLVYQKFGPKPTPRNVPDNVRPLRNS